MEGVESAQLPRGLLAIVAPDTPGSLKGPLLLYRVNEGSVASRDMPPCAHPRQCLGEGWGAVSLGVSSGGVGGGEEGSPV